MCGNTKTSLVQFARADGALNVSIIREPEGNPPGVYQAATPVTLTCTHNGSSSATYSWTCSGESNCFTQGFDMSSKRRGVLRGGDTGTHTCNVVSNGMSVTASTSITVTGKFVLFSTGQKNALFVAYPLQELVLAIKEVEKSLNMLPITLQFSFLKKARLVPVHIL